MALELCPKPISSDKRLESIAQGELNLPRVEGGARRPVIRAWRSFQEALRSTSLGRWIEWAEISRAVYGVEESKRGCVQQVESFAGQLDFLIPVDIRGPCETDT